MTIRLADADARALEAFCRRQLRWDATLPGRVVSTPSALGVFTAPPLGVLVFVAVPADGVDRPVDATVTLAGLADALRDHPEELGLDRLARAMIPPAPAPSLNHLPPADGWQLPITAVSGDLVPLVEAATREFSGRAAGSAPREQQEVAEEIWSRPGFGGLPIRALHAARQLGMLPADSSRIAAATSGQWRRLSTSRGQVFSYASGPAARLALQVVR